MPKIAPSGKVGIPVPAPDPTRSPAVFLVCYFGAVGFTPNYDQAERIEVAIGLVPIQSAQGVDYYAFDSSLIPASIPEGDYDLHFTLKDAVGNEGDFSPAIDIPLDHVPPPTLGQPILLS